MDSSEPDTSSPDHFVNDPLAVDGLPRLDDHAFEPIDPSYVRMRSTLAGAVAVIVAATTVALVAASTSVWVALVGTVVLALVILVGVLHRVEVAHMGFLVRTHDLSFRRGVITRSVATVPFARVQHVSIARGPIDRQYGLASLQLRTAGGQLAIPGLAVDVADRLKQLVADRAGELADAESSDDTELDVD